MAPRLAVALPPPAEFNPTPRPVRLIERDPSRRQADQWFIVEDPSRRETAAEREQRYLSDDRRITMAGLHVISQRQYATVKKLNMLSGIWRDRLRDISPIDEEDYDRLVEQRIALARAGRDAEAEAVAAELLKMDKRREGSPFFAEMEFLRTKLTGALPEPIKDGWSPTWPVGKAMRACRQLKWLDAWYEPVLKLPPGKERGTRNRPKAAGQG
ncbi:hypothetical protein [Actinoplanes sp. URMC 104]|uniref:hypothetical protein n=1 Tax=Actinoplanes sp. URMC 104 TaxID=3423409 RepID=UPI003F1B2F57